jgi:hypothetical protein
MCCWHVVAVIAGGCASGGRMYVASVLLSYFPVAVQVVERCWGYIGLSLVVAVQVL